MEKSQKLKDSIDRNKRSVALLGEDRDYEKRS